MWAEATGHLAYMIALDVLYQQLDLVITVQAIPGHIDNKAAIFRILLHSTKGASNCLCD